MITNGTLADVHITNAACDVRAATARITQGASGTIDKSCRGPWAIRLESCLHSVLDEEEGPALGIMDAPTPPEIRDAIRAVRQLHPMFERVHADSSKRIVLEGPAGTSYMSMQKGTEAEPMLTLTSSGDMWEFLKEPYSLQDHKHTWSHVIETVLPAYDSMRLADALSVICGSTVSYSERRLHYSYPEGATVPEAMIKYVKCGAGVKPGTITVSRTRGITAVSVDGCTPAVTVVVQLPAVAAEADSADGQALQLVKSLVEASTAAETGSAYFALQELMPAVSDRARVVANQIMYDVDVRYNRTRALAAPQFGRQASHAV